ncbi:MAG: hypothetical protein NVSMB64_18280 [Candidatus Velthaea sp.]
MSDSRVILPEPGRDFGVLAVDAAAPEPRITSQYIHVWPTIERRAAIESGTPALDLINHGGKISYSLTQHNLYVNCPSSCWAVPAGFEINLGRSAMMHIVNQYGARGTFDYGGGGQVSYSKVHTLEDTDMVKIVTAFIKAFHTPAGYGAMYNVFIAPGIDQCENRPNVYDGCYSPDVPSTFEYCGYHSAADVTGIGHILYSVEPYQKVKGCAETSVPLNGVLADSTQSTLSHEIFETITDPDGKAWFNSNGDEIGDLCNQLYTVVTLYNRQYKIQSEYSNRTHNCQV